MWYSEPVTVQISSSCRPVFSCLSNAVLLPAPIPEEKTLFYLWSSSADTICSVSLLMPRKMTAPSPLFRRQITAQGAPVKQKIPNHIRLIPSVVTGSVLVQLKFAAAEIPRPVLLQWLCKFPTKKTLLLSLHWGEQKKKTAEESLKAVTRCKRLL